MSTFNARRCVEGGTLTNGQRARHAEAALRRWHLGKGADDPSDALCDLLADLMHYAEKMELSFNDELARAVNHYDYER